METVYGLLVYVGVFLIGVFGAKWASSFVKNNRQGADLISISLPLGMVLLVASFLSISFFLHDITDSISFFLYALLAMGLVLMVLFDSKLSAAKYITLTIGLCFISTYFLPSLPLLGDGISGILLRVALAVAWGLGVWIFVQMDRVPFFSMTFSIAFALFFFFLANLSRLVPDIFGNLALLILCTQVGINWYLKRGERPVLGSIAGAFIGFVWGGMTVYVMGLGYLTQGLILYAYPMMEVLWSTLVSIALYQRCAPVYPYMVEQALSKNIQPDKVLKSVTKWIAVMAGLAYLSVVNVNLSMSVFYVALFLLMANACMRLTSWGEWGAKGPRVRDVIKDFGLGLRQAKEDWSKLPLKEVKDQVFAMHHKKEEQPVSSEKTSANTKNKKNTVKKGAQVKRPQKQALNKSSPKTKRGG